MIEKIKSSLGQSDLEKCSEAWSKFIKIQQDAGESTKCYVSRFEQVESWLKNVQIVIPNIALVIHLLSQSRMSSQSKENILTKTELEGDLIYSSLKKSMRELKSDLTSSSDNKTISTNETFYSDRSRKCCSG